jgi:ribosomal protein S18 acetylase RimI-like enzyme
MTSDQIDFGFFEILRARAQDIPTIQEIDAHSLVSSVPMEWFEERHAHYKDRFFIAREHWSGNIIGFITAAHTSYYPQHLPGYVYIARFAITEKYRRCGVGSALLSTLVDHLVAAGEYRGVVADVRRGNIASANFFTKKHLFFTHQWVSCPNWYERGETAESRYKIVVYKPFVLDDP